MVQKSFVFMCYGFSNQRSDGVFALLSWNCGSLSFLISFGFSFFSFFFFLFAFLYYLISLLLFHSSFSSPFSFLFFLFCFVFKNGKCFLTDLGIPACIYYFEFLNTLIFNGQNIQTISNSKIV